MQDVEDSTPLGGCRNIQAAIDGGDAHGQVIEREVLQLIALQAKAHKFGRDVLSGRP